MIKMKAYSLYSFSPLCLGKSMDILWDTKQTNSAGPDQTAPMEQSDLDLHFLFMHSCLN